MIYSIFNGKFYNADGTYWRYYCYYGRNFDKIFHREDGPAMLRFDSNGNVLEMKYYIHGEEVSEIEWQCEYGWKLQLKDTPMGDLYGN